MPERRSSRTDYRYQAQAASGMDKTTKIAMIVSLVLFVGAAITVFLVWSKVSAENAAVQRRIDDSAAALERVKNYKSKSPEDYDGLLKVIDDVVATNALIENGNDWREVDTIRSQAVSKKNREDFEKNLKDTIAELQRTADDRNKIDNNLATIVKVVEAAADISDQKILEEAGGLFNKLLDNAVTFKAEKIKKFRENNPQDLEGLLDEYVKAIQDLEKLALTQGLTREVIEKIREQVIGLRAEEYEYAIEYFNNNKETVRWTNLLDGTRAKMWKSSGPVKFNITNGQMVVESTLGHGGKERGTMLASTRDMWIDYSIEMDVTIESAGFVILGRYADSQNFYQLTVEAGGEDNPIVAGGRYKIWTDAVADSAGLHMAKILDNGTTEEIDLASPEFKIPDKAIAGAFGIAVNPGGKLIFHELKVRIIRDVP